MSAKFKLGYIPELDGLRGTAIICVMLYHAGAQFLKGGFIGVDIFFVLSGFLITALLVQEYELHGNVMLKNFYMRRALRLLPALAFMLVVFCIVSFLFFNKNLAQENYIDALISLMYLSNWAKAYSIHPPNLIGHTWSLSIEEQFYILWPSILLLLLHIFKNRASVATILLFLAIASGLLRVYLLFKGAPVDRLYFGLDTRADSLLIGSALGLIIASGLINANSSSIIQNAMVVLAPLSVVSLVAIAYFGKVADTGTYSFDLFIVEVLSAVLILNILTNPGSLVAKLLSIKWLVWIGTISYGLYLWHYPVFRIMQLLGFRGYVIISAGSLITLMAALISYHFMEIPALKLKKRFAQSHDTSLGS